MEDNIYNSFMNFNMTLLNKFISDYDEYKNDLNVKTNTGKKYIKDTVNKYTSLIIVLILLYFLKDFLMWLLVKFDKLLKD
jgi:hypothetical protein